MPSLPIRIILLPVLAFVLNTLHAQQFSIADGSITTCSGVLEDTGGPSGDYGNNEEHVLTICPDTPGDAISLNWVVFELSTQLPQPIDRMELWDGDNMSADFLGMYTGTQLQGLVSSATIYNISGCLTLRFTSNAGGTGNFAAGITCYTPCERPTAVATMSQPGPPALVCVGEEVTFDGTGSYAADGFNIVEYNWNFADGTTVDSPTATHAFAEPGEYMVQLQLVDDNDCVNSNMVDLQVLVSTTPDFSGTSESVEVCLGAVVDLNAVVTPTTWTGNPEANFGDGIYLPDDLGIPFISELVFTQFEPGQTLNSTNDLLSVCTNMEHSFMGDLVVEISCPNGQSTILHQQGGGGTYLGGANDTDNNSNPVPGECWQYCWSDNATLASWAECAANGPTPNVMQGGIPPNNALIPDTYSPVQPLSNLVGCPLNGTWSFTITDLWGIDNGFLCDWSINFNPAIIPDVTQFTPVLGTSTIDSAAWSGPFVETPDPNAPLVAQAVLDEPGTFSYTFTVMDNFGCSYDTTLSLTIDPPMEIDAGPAIALCNDSVPMAGAITANGPSNDCEWTIEMYDSWGDGWNGAGAITVTVDGVSQNYSNLPSGGTTQIATITVTNGSTMSVSYTTGLWNNENSFTIFDDQGNQVYASPTDPAAGLHWTGTGECGGAPPVTFAWTPTDGLADPSSPTSMVWVDMPTWYYLQVYLTGSPECAVVDSVLVSPPPNLDPGEDGVAITCISYGTFLMTDSLGGTPDLNGEWTLGNATLPAEFDPLAQGEGTFTLTYTVTSDGGCTASAELQVTVLPDTDPSCCGVPDAGPDDFSCNLSYTLNATPGNTGVGVWSGPPGAVFADAQDPGTTVALAQGMGGPHWLYWRENDGTFCNTVDSVLITFTDAIELAFTTTDAICNGHCDGTAQVVVTGGNAGNGFSYDWSSGSMGTSTVTGLCAGTFELTVTDDNGCTGTNDFSIAEPELLQIDSLAATDVTCSGDCDGQVMVFDANAVAYSFDGGLEWGPSSLNEEACEGIQQVSIRDAAGCVANGSILVSGPPPVEAGFTWLPNPTNVDNPTVVFTNHSTGASTYEWDIAGLATSTAVNEQHTFSDRHPGTYRVCLTAYNANQCVDSVCHYAVVEDVLLTYVPNAFTPDADGVNDGFLMTTTIPVITTFELLIFDRWGKQVFKTNDPYEPWLGKQDNSGKVLPQGVYAYRIRYEVKGQDTMRELNGHVTLLK